MDFKVVDSKKWDTLPQPVQPKPKSQYDELINALEKGDIIQLTVSDVKEMRGLRIAIGRLASVKGFTVDFRNEELSLFAKKSDRPLPVKEPKEKKKKGVETPPNSDWDKWNGALAENEPEKEPKTTAQKA